MNAGGTQGVLALDQGTTSSRAIVFDRAGQPAAVAQGEFPQIYPQAGWVEQDPDAILHSQLEAARTALAQAPGVRALGIANQRETTLVWERATGKPVYNAIVWQDRRGAAQCERLRQDGAEEMVRGKTGLLLDPYFSATKVRWILDNVGGARAAAEAGRLCFGTVDSWLVWQMTGGKRRLTDRTNASRTLMYNIVEDRWDPELLRLFGVPEAMLPEVVWSSETLGPATVDPLKGLESAGIAGDQQAALFGQLCMEPGEAKNTYGTGCFLLRHAGGRFRLSEHRLITTLAASAHKRLEYALEGSVFVGGAVVQWLRDKMRFFSASAEVEQAAASVPDAGGIVFVPAFTGLGAPHWDPHATGLIIGLGRGTEAGHIARAALESIAFQVADVMEAMERDAGTPFTELRVDGGAASNGMLMQFQADLCGVPVRRPACRETTALGAAYLAGLATGFWAGPGEIAKSREPDTIFAPQADRAEMLHKQARWREAVERARGWHR